jgi:hypothetical protein
MGGWRGIYKPTASVVRSTDGGKSWKSLTNNPDFGPDGGKEAVCLRVNPKTRELLVGSMCHGQWKIGSPGSETRISKAPESAIPRCSAHAPVTVSGAVIHVAPGTGRRIVEIRDCFGRMVEQRSIDNGSAVTIPLGSSGARIVSVSSNSRILSSMIISCGSRRD